MLTFAEIRGPSPNRPTVSRPRIAREHEEAAAIMGEEFSAPQLAALSHPFDGGRVPNSACTWYMLAEGGSAILTCDVDVETAESFGGPVWHASVCPPIRAHAEVLLAGVGEGVLFDEPGLAPGVYHLRRRMTLDEIKRIGGLSS